MKLFVVLALVLLCGSGMAQQPAQQAAPATPVHIGVFVYQRTQAENKPDNLYHIGGDVCTQGSEHYGPECVREVVTPRFYEKASLTLDDGRVLSVHGALVDVARGEAMIHGDRGTWRVSYEFGESRLNPFTRHTLQYVKVVFPVPVGDKIVPVTKHIMFDVSDKFLNASTVEQK